MKRLSLTILGGLVLASVAACHTDPFGTQPEVNVTLPEAQSAPSDEAGASTEEKRDPETGESHERVSFLFGGDVEGVAPAGYNR